jgi:2-methylisocitrate lyase-like PEP mutase family enzyme
MVQFTVCILNNKYAVYYLCYSHSLGSGNCFMYLQEKQAAKAEIFRHQHLDKKLLILPNIWDTMGARLMEITGFPSVATASVSVAISNGFADGENIPFDQLLTVVRKISESVNLPVTVDMERGYAESISQLKENIHLLIEHGAVGINLEDSRPDHKSLCNTDEQCRKIEAVRETGVQTGVPIVINARTDCFFLKITDAFTQAVQRAMAYKSAGADCVYPILMNNYDEISQFISSVNMPVNVVLLKPVSDLKRLEEIGVARVSVGPQLLNHVLSTMKQVAEGLLHYDTTVFFGRELLPRDFLDRLV